MEFKEAAEKYYLSINRRENANLGINDIVLLVADFVRLRMHFEIATPINRDVVISHEDFDERFFSISEIDDTSELGEILLALVDEATTDPSDELEGFRSKLMNVFLDAALKDEG